MKRQLLGPIVLLVGSWLASQPVAQSVLVVEPTGAGGAPFTTIGAAIAAAQDGDLVLVKDGIYPEAVTLDGKGLVVVAEVGASHAIGDSCSLYIQAALPAAPVVHMGFPTQVHALDPRF